MKHGFVGTCAKINKIIADNFSSFTNRPEHRVRCSSEWSWTATRNNIYPTLSCKFLSRRRTVASWRDRQASCVTVCLKIAFQTCLRCSCHIRRILSKCFCTYISEWISHARSHLAPYDSTYTHSMRGNVSTDAPLCGCRPNELAED